MGDEEKKLLLQILLEDMRGSFPLSGWGDQRMIRACELAKDLGLDAHVKRITELAESDYYRDGRHFRVPFEYGGYEGMEKCHGLRKTYEDKSQDFQREARSYLEYPEYGFEDWKAA